MGQRIIQVDAFTSTPFTGNPAAVCILPAPADATWMQQVAREMNLAETAFLVKRTDGFDLRWFTPTVEADLCGHATLASAHVLWEEGHLTPGEPGRFHSNSGVLIARQGDGWIELDFPATPASAIPAPAGLAEALGVTPAFIGQSQFDFLVEVETEAEVRGVVPDFARVRQFPVRGVMVTSRSDAPEFDFVSRFFGPAAGIDEDPVTGSAHCALGPHWQARLGKDQLVSYQASARGGVVRVSVRGERIGLGGQAVTVLRGELLS